ncbi:MAG: hypothetical protein AB4352_08890 [Hormoscilla sp.]
MKHAKINNKNLVATSIATAILVITGSTPVIGAATVTDATAVTDATTAAPNRVNNGEVIIACPFPPWCDLLRQLLGNQGDAEQKETAYRKETVYQENGRAATIAPSNKRSCI